MNIEKSMVRRSCWVCLMEASVTKLVKVGPCRRAGLAACVPYTPPPCAAEPA